MRPCSPIRFLTIAALPLFGACASVPKPLHGEFAAITASKIVESGRQGDNVRWGGIVVEVEPEAERTCLQILSRPLSDIARPRDRDISEGRFLACRAGFYDPEVFTKGREVTVTGRVASTSERTIGEYRYVMPEVAADVIYLWPERLDHDRIYVGYGFGPFHDPWWPHGGWYGGYRHYSRQPISPPKKTESTTPSKN